MRYKGKACETVGEKEVFGQRVAWVRTMEDGSFHEVPSHHNRTKRLKA